MRYEIRIFLQLIGDVFLMILFMMTSTLFYLKMSFVLSDNDSYIELIIMSASRTW